MRMVIVMIMILIYKLYECIMKKQEVFKINENNSHLHISVNSDGNI